MTSPQPSPAAQDYDAKRFAFDWVERNAGRLSEFNAHIWALAEPAWREYDSAKAYVDLLRAEGFTVEAGSGGMPTAFAASWGEGRPAVGSFSEYDAVPGNSQQVVPYQAPRAGLNRWAAGHTDPHSMLGTAALTGILATKAAMERFGIPGKLTLFGEPAEKVCGSKPVHAARGYYDGYDAFVVYHPSAVNSVAFTTQCGSYWSAAFSFECLDPEQWIDSSLLPIGGSHAAARCPGAIDALCLMYTLTKYTKEAMFPHTGTWTLNEFIMVGGDATSDNLPPRFSQIQYSWRSPTLGIQEQIYRVLENNARQAAGATGCTADVRWISKTRVGLPNEALAELTFANLRLAGAPAYGDEAMTFAREIQRNLGLEPMDDPFADSVSQLTTPQAYEDNLRRALPPWQRNFTSDDYVEYTWHAPTARLFTARPALRSPGGGYEYPAWAYNALGGLPAGVDPGLFAAGKTISGTLLDLLTNQAALDDVQAEFTERTGGGVGGERWVAPLFPDDFEAPIELRWPEYVTDGRGQAGWWIPTEDGSRGRRL